MNPKTLATLLAAVAAVSLAGCAYPPYGGSNYRAYQAGVEQSVRFGVVEAVRVVNLDAPYTGLGGATGAMLGGIAGSTVGKGSGQLAGAVAGAVIGGIIGSNVEADANKGEGLEITVLEEYDHTLYQRLPHLVRADDGTYRQPEGSPRLPLMFALVARKPG